MANIVFGYNNRTDLATLSGGAWSSTLPQINLQNRLLTKVARTATDANADTIINVDFGAPYAIGVVALLAHNLSVDAKVRIRGDNTSSAMGAVIYDSGWVDVWAGGIVPIHLLEWEDDNFWLGTLTPLQRAGFIAPFINIDLGRTVARYWRIEIDDEDNADGFVQIGRLFMSDIWQPTYNYAYGAGLGYEDPSVSTTSVGGQEYFDQRNRYRVLKLQLGWVTEAEAYGQKIEMDRLIGVSGELLVIPDYEDTTNGVRRNFIGRMRSLSPVVAEQARDSAGPLFSVDMDIRESI